MSNCSPRTVLCSGAGPLCHPWVSDFRLRTSDFGFYSHEHNPHIFAIRIPILTFLAKMSSIKKIRPSRPKNYLFTGAGGGICHPCGQLSWPAGDHPQGETHDLRFTKPLLYFTPPNLLQSQRSGLDRRPAVYKTAALLHPAIFCLRATRRI